MKVLEPSLRITQFVELLGRGFSQALSQVGLPSAKVEAVAAKNCSEKVARMGDKLYRITLTGSESFRGAATIITSEPEALQLGQILMSESPDRLVEFNNTHRNATAELIRQVAGHTTELCEPVLGGKVELSGPGFKAAEDSSIAGGLRISGENFSEVMVVLALSAEFASVLNDRSDASSPTTSSSTRGSVTSKIAPDAGENSNFDLLLDVQLEATIRFGERQLLMRDVLSMAPGSVVELDREIHEPAELLIAGRLIARGDVVVVDGNFGLRITELASPNQRAELLQLGRG